MQSSRRLWDGNRAPCSQLLLPLPPTTCCKQQSSKHLQQETEESLQLGFAALPKTYKLLDFLIVISRLLSEVVGAAHHSCCYLVYGIPLCIQVGIYTTTLLVWIFFGFKQSDCHHCSSGEEKGSPNLLYCKHKEDQM